MAQPQLAGPATEFTVLAAEGQRVGAAEQAIRNAGGTVVNTNTAVGLITAAASGFTERASANRAVFGAAKAKSIGSVPKDKAAPKPDVVEKEAHGSGARNAWGLKSVRSDLSRTVQPGDKRVKVVIIDTGVDGSYPDIAPDFDKANSRNFTRDIPTDVTGAVVIASRRG
jgi:hypothetical protein